MPSMALVSSRISSSGIQSAARISMRRSRVMAQRIAWSVRRSGGGMWSQRRRCSLIGGQGMNPYLVAFLTHAAVLVIGYLLGHRRRHG